MTVKHPVLVISAGALILLLVSCNWSGGSNPMPEERRGSLVVSLDLAGRSGPALLAVDTSVAKGTADVVEVLVIPSTAPTAETVTSILLDPETDLDAPVSISLDEGFYRVLVLVGDKSGDSATLLAAGASSGLVEIVAGTQSDVPVTLATVDLDITVSAPLVAGEEYTVDLSGDTNVPILTLESSGDTATYSGQYKLDEDSSYTEFTITTAGSAWSASLLLEAPMTAGDTTWNFSGPYVTYNDSATGAFCPVRELSQLGWRWLSTTLVSDTNPLSDQVRIPLSFGVGATSLAVTIAWPD